MSRSDAPARSRSPRARSPTARPRRRPRSPSRRGRRCGSPARWRCAPRCRRMSAPSGPCDTRPVRGRGASPVPRRPSAGGCPTAGRAGCRGRRPGGRRCSIRRVLFRSVSSLSPWNRVVCVLSMGRGSPWGSTWRVSRRAVGMCGPFDGDGGERSGSPRAGDTAVIGWVRASPAAAVAGSGWGGTATRRARRLPEQRAGTCVAVGARRRASATSAARTGEADDGGPCAPAAWLG